MAYKAKSRAFFVYGFAKNVRATVSDAELRALKRYAQELLGYDNRALDVALQSGELIEVESNEQVHPGNSPR